MTTQHHPKPQSVEYFPRFSGSTNFMRLPNVSDWHQLDIGIIGVPFDGGTTNRAGTRHGPREVRNASSLIRLCNCETGIEPYALARIGDLGDVPINPIDTLLALEQISQFYRQVKAHRLIPLSIGGDHLSTLPIFRGIVSPDNPIGLIHFDAHSDTTDTYFGGLKYTHGTPFRRAIEEGLLDPKRTIQIGIRGSVFAQEDEAFALDNGVTIIHMHEFEQLSIAAVLQQIKATVGNAPTYLSFDIDVLDPCFAPGTGTPEIGGMTTREALQLLRGLRGLSLVGADVVEVSPPFDQGNLTSLTGASIAFEILCLLAESFAADNI